MKKLMLAFAIVGTLLMVSCSTGTKSDQPTEQSPEMVAPDTTSVIDTNAVQTNDAI